MQTTINQGQIYLKKSKEKRYSKSRDRGRTKAYKEIIEICQKTIEQEKLNATLQKFNKTQQELKEQQQKQLQGQNVDKFMYSKKWEEEKQECIENLKQLENSKKENKKQELETQINLEIEFENQKQKNLEILIIESKDLEIQLDKNLQDLTKYKNEDDQKQLKIEQQQIQNILQELVDLQQDFGNNEIELQQLWENIKKDNLSQDELKQYQSEIELINTKIQIINNDISKKKGCHIIRKGDGQKQEKSEIALQWDKEQEILVKQTLPDLRQKQQQTQDKQELKILNYEIEQNEKLMQAYQNWVTELKNLEKKIFTMEVDIKNEKDEQQNEKNIQKKDELMQTVEELKILKNEYNEKFLINQSMQKQMILSNIDQEKENLRKQLQKNQLVINAIFNCCKERKTVSFEQIVLNNKTYMKSQQQCLLEEEIKFMGSNINKNKKKFEKCKEDQKELKKYYEDLVWVENFKLPIQQQFWVKIGEDLEKLILTIEQDLLYFKDETDQKELKIEMESTLKYQKYYQDQKSHFEYLENRLIELCEEQKNCSIKEKRDILEEEIKEVKEEIVGFSKICQKKFSVNRDTINDKQPKPFISEKLQKWRNEEKEDLKILNQVQMQLQQSKGLDDIDKYVLSEIQELKEMKKNEYKKWIRGQMKLEKQYTIIRQQYKNSQSESEKKELKVQKKQNEGDQKKIEDQKTNFEDLEVKMMQKYKDMESEKDPKKVKKIKQSVEELDKQLKEFFVDQAKIQDESSVDQKINPVQDGNNQENENNQKQLLLIKQSLKQNESLLKQWKKQQKQKKEIYQKFSNDGKYIDDQLPQQQILWEIDMVEKQMVIYKKWIKYLQDIIKQQNSINEEYDDSQKDQFQKEKLSSQFFKNQEYIQELIDLKGYFQEIEDQARVVAEIKFKDNDIEYSKKNNIIIQTFLCFQDRIEWILKYCLQYQLNLCSIGEKMYKPYVKSKDFKQIDDTRARLDKLFKQTQSRFNNDIDENVILDENYKDKNINDTTLMNNQSQIDETQNNDNSNKNDDSINQSGINQQKTNNNNNQSSILESLQKNDQDQNQQDSDQDKDGEEQKDGEEDEDVDDSKVVQTTQNSKSQKYQKFQTEKLNFYLLEQMILNIFQLEKDQVEKLVFEIQSDIDYYKREKNEQLVSYQQELLAQVQEYKKQVDNIQQVNFFMLDKTEKNLMVQLEYIQKDDKELLKSVQRSNQSYISKFQLVLEELKRRNNDFIGFQIEYVNNQIIIKKRERELSDLKDIGTKDIRIQKYYQQVYQSKIIKQKNEIKDPNTKDIELTKHKLKIYEAVFNFTKQQIVEYEEWVKECEKQDFIIQINQDIIQACQSLQKIIKKNKNGEYILDNIEQIDSKKLNEQQKNDLEQLIQLKKEKKEQLDCFSNLYEQKKVIDKKFFRIIENTLKIRKDKKKKIKFELLNEKLEKNEALKKQLSGDDNQQQMETQIDTPMELQQLKNKIDDLEDEIQQCDQNKDKDKKQKVQNQLKFCQQQYENYSKYYQDQKQNEKMIKQVKLLLATCESDEQKQIINKNYRNLQENIEQMDSWKEEIQNLFGQFQNYGDFIEIQQNLKNNTDKDEIEMNEIKMKIGKMENWMQEKIKTSNQLNDLWQNYDIKDKDFQKNLKEMEQKGDIFTNQLKNMPKIYKNEEINILQEKIVEQVKLKEYIQDSEEFQTKVKEIYKNQKQLQFFQNYQEEKEKQEEYYSQDQKYIISNSKEKQISNFYKTEIELVKSDIDQLVLLKDDFVSLEDKCKQMNNQLMQESISDENNFKIQKQINNNQIKQQQISEWLHKNIQFQEKLRKQKDLLYNVKSDNPQKFSKIIKEIQNLRQEKKVLDEQYPGQSIDITKTLKLIKEIEKSIADCKDAKLKKLMQNQKKFLEQYLIGFQTYYKELELVELQKGEYIQQKDNITQDDLKQYYEQELNKISKQLNILKYWKQDFIESGQIVLNRFEDLKVKKIDENQVSNLNKQIGIYSIKNNQMNYWIKKYHEIQIKQREKKLQFENENSAKTKNLFQEQVYFSELMSAKHIENYKGNIMEMHITQNKKDLNEKSIQIEKKAEEKEILMKKQREYEFQLSNLEIWQQEKDILNYEIEKLEKKQLESKDCDEIEQFFLKIQEQKKKIENLENWHYDINYVYQQLINIEQDLKTESRKMALKELNSQFEKFKNLKTKLLNTFENQQNLEVKIRDTEEKIEVKQIDQQNDDDVALMQKLIQQYKQNLQQFKIDYPFNQRECIKYQKQILELQKREEIISGNKKKEKVREKISQVKNLEELLIKWENQRQQEYEKYLADKNQKQKSKVPEEQDYYQWESKEGEVQIMELDDWCNKFSNLYKYISIVETSYEMEEDKLIKNELKANLKVQYKEQKDMIIWIEQKLILHEKKREKKKERNKTKDPQKITQINQEVKEINTQIKNQYLQKPINSKNIRQLNQEIKYLQERVKESDNKKDIKMFNKMIQEKEILLLTYQTFQQEKESITKRQEKYQKKLEQIEDPIIKMQLEEEINNSNKKLDQIIDWKKEFDKNQDKIIEIKNKILENKIKNPDKLKNLEQQLEQKENIRQQLVKWLQEKVKLEEGLRVLKDTSFGETDPKKLEEMMKQIDQAINDIQLFDRTRPGSQLEQIVNLNQKISQFQEKLDNTTDTSSKQFLQNFLDILESSKNSYQVWEIEKETCKNRETFYKQQIKKKNGWEGQLYFYENLVNHFKFQLNNLDKWVYYFDILNEDLYQGVETIINCGEEKFKIQLKEKQNLLEIKFKDMVQWINKKIELENIYRQQLKQDQDKYNIKQDKQVFDILWHNLNKLWGVRQNYYDTELDIENLYNKSYYLKKLLIINKTNNDVDLGIKYEKYLNENKNYLEIYTSYKEISETLQNNLEYNKKILQKCDNDLQKQNIQKDEKDIEEQKIMTLEIMKLMCKQRQDIEQFRLILDSEIKNGTIDKKDIDFKQYQLSFMEQRNDIQYNLIKEILFELQEIRNLSKRKIITTDVKVQAFLEKQVNQAVEQMQKSRDFQQKKQKLLRFYQESYEKMIEIENLQQENVQDQMKKMEQEMHIANQKMGVLSLQKTNLNNWQGQIRILKQEIGETSYNQQEKEQIQLSIYALEGKIKDLYQNQEKIEEQQQKAYILQEDLKKNEKNFDKRQICEAQQKIYDIELNKIYYQNEQNILNKYVDKIMKVQKLMIKCVPRQKKIYQEQLQQAKTKEQNLKKNIEEKCIILERKKKVEKKILEGKNQKEIDKYKQEYGDLIIAVKKIDQGQKKEDFDIHMEVINEFAPKCTLKQKEPLRQYQQKQQIYLEEIEEIGKIIDNVEKQYKQLNIQKKKNKDVQQQIFIEKQIEYQLQIIKDLDFYDIFINMYKRNIWDIEEILWVTTDKQKILEYKSQLKSWEEKVNDLRYFYDQRKYNRVQIEKFEKQIYDSQDQQKQQLYRDIILKIMDCNYEILELINQNENYKRLIEVQRLIQIESEDQSERMKIQKDILNMKNFFDQLEGQFLNLKNKRDEFIQEYEIKIQKRQEQYMIEQEEERRKKQEEEQKQLQELMKLEQERRAKRKAREEAQFRNNQKMEEFRKEKNQILKEQNEVISQELQFTDESRYLEKLIDSLQEKLKQRRQKLNLQQKRKLDLKDKISNFIDTKTRLDKELKEVDLSEVQKNCLNIDNNDISYIKGLRNPPERIKFTTECVLSIIYNTSRNIPWEDQKIILQDINFRHLVQVYDPIKMSNRVLDKVQKIQQSTVWNITKIFKAAKTVGYLAEWVNQVVKYKIILKENKDLLDACQKCRQQEQQLQDEMKELMQIEEDEISFIDEEQQIMNEIDILKLKKQEIDQKYQIIQPKREKLNNKLQRMNTNELELEEIVYSSTEL